MYVLYVYNRIGLCFLSDFSNCKY